MMITMVSAWRVPIVQLVAHRRLSSNARKARNYLETWVGSSNASSPTMMAPAHTAETTRTHAVGESTSPLLLSGSSYLMPTLRLERNDTAESIKNRIGLAVEESSSAPSAAVVRSMLKGKTTKDGMARWRVPIILDTSALVPDGSPHYVPPSHGLLSDVVNVLSDFGIQVVGVTNPPLEVEHEAVHRLGLPAVLSISRALDRQTDAKFRIQDVVQLVLIKVAEETDESNTGNVGECEGANSVASNELTGVSSDKLTQDTFPNGDSEEGTMNGTEMSDDLERTEAASVESENSVPNVQHLQGGTRVYHGNVRSGQQIAAERNQSLVVIGSVSSGGEVLADRDIFVFGRLRGRALAGLVPNEAEETARIFATSFDPELVCLGDTFTTVDNVQDLGLDQPGEAVMVRLNSQNELLFESIPLK